MQCGYYFGKYLENNIDSLVSTAYIKINNGDIKEIKKYNKNNIRKIIGIILSIGGSVITGILSGKIIEYIYTFINK
jgi:hypothetical protein